MIGIIHHALKVMVVELFGQELWEKVLRENNIDIDIEFYALENYEDGPLVSIVVSLAKNLGLSVDDCLYKFGVWIIPYLMENGYKEHISCLGDNFKDFLNNVNSHHIFINQYSFKQKLIFPQFNCETNADGSLNLHYFSRRPGLAAFTKGIVEVCAETLFGLKIEMIATDINNETNMNQTYQHVIFKIRSMDKLPLFVAPNKKKAYSRENSLSEKPVLSYKDFCIISPTHICFDKKMLIEHCGEFLQKELGFSSKQPTHLATLFEIVQPDFEFLNFKNISKNLNSPYIFKLKRNLKRNSKDNSYDKLYLIGQMYLINNGDNLLYVNSPYITTAIELKKTNMYFSDLAKADTTRDLLVLNQARVYQNTANEMLSKSIKIKRERTTQLDIIKAQNNRLLYELIPQSIAERRRQELGLDFIEEFSDVTCMITSLTYFDIIQNRCNAKQVVQILTHLYKEFDRLIKLHRCQKVSRTIESYHVVAGMPNKVPDHAARILNLALGFIYESLQIVVPEVNLPVMVKVGVHTGPVIGALVGEAKLRYCVLGEGIDIPKRLLEMDIPEQIVMTNATKQSVSKNSHEKFEFTSLGYKQVRKNQATCTFRLIKNESKSIWDIIQQSREGYSEDGYDDLQKNYFKEWAKLDRLQKKRSSMELTQTKSQNREKTIPGNFLHHTRGRRFNNKAWRRATKTSQDSGLSVGSHKSVDSVDSVSCAVM